MPSYVVKISPDETGYVLWSTVTDSPHFWGTREELYYHLLYTGEGPPESINDRFDRADATGTSALHRDYQWGEGFIVEQRGWLDRKDLRRFLESFDEPTQSFDWSLLRPFED